MSRNLSFLIAARPIDKSAGIVVLHRLADALIKLGHKAYIIFYSGNPAKANFHWSNNQSYYDKELLHTEFDRTPDDKTYIKKLIAESYVIYPEVISGNPLNAKRAVRYFLNSDGVLTGTPSNYSEKDYKLTFDPIFKRDANSILSTIITDKLFTRSDSAPEAGRTLDITFIGKGQMFGPVYTIHNSTIITRNWPDSKMGLARLLKSTRYFFSWDAVSSTNCDALLCGAKPVFLRCNKNEKTNLEQGLYGPFPHIEGSFKNNIFEPKTSHAEFGKKREKFIENYLNKAKNWLCDVEKTVNLIEEFFHKQEYEMKSDTGISQAQSEKNTIKTSSSLSIQKPRCATNIFTQSKEISNPISDEIFEDSETQLYENLASAYSNNPMDSGVFSQLQQLQQGLMNFLVRAQTDKLEFYIKGNFGRVFRALVNSGLPSEAPTKETSAQLAVLDEALNVTEDPNKIFDYRPLLARMLLAPAHRGLVCLAPEKIPSWLLEDYFTYIFHAPQVFVAFGEAELYHSHLLQWAHMVHKRTCSSPSAVMTRRLASVFAVKVNGIPLYLSLNNTRELMQLRATILEFILLQNGASIDSKQSKRPKGRPKLKIGFLSAHFGAQTETHVTLPALQLKREKFEICMFAVSSNPGPIEEYCRSFADSFTLLPNELASQVKAIREAKLDIVIIGTNITAVTNQISLIALHRLAPIQLASYCSPASTGMRHIDGYLTGTLNNYQGLQDHFSEKLYFCEGPPGCLDYTVESPGSGKTFNRANLGMAEDDLVFINAAACFKILPEMQETWAKILAAVPKSRLLLLPFNPNWSNAFPVKQFERTLAEACARHGVGRERFILAGSLPSRADVKALERIADVYLDMSPFSGSISIIDPLELGLPIVVQEGSTHRSRMASALLKEIDLPELITTDEAAYIALAVRLGTNAPYRRQLNDRILAAMARRPKFLNPQAYAEGLGALLESLMPLK